MAADNNVASVLQVLDRIKLVLLSNEMVSPLAAKALMEGLCCPPDDAEPCPWFDKVAGQCVQYNERPLACVALGQNDDACRYWRKAKAKTT